MTSLILRTTARYLMPLLLIFSVFLFWRGHNQPGGGFAGGLVAAASFALLSIAYGALEARRVLQFIRCLARKDWSLEVIPLPTEQTSP